MDGAGRRVFIEINTENIKLIIDQLVDKFWWLFP